MLNKKSDTYEDFIGIFEKNFKGYKYKYLQIREQCFIFNYDKLIRHFHNLALVGPYLLQG